MVRFSLLTAGHCTHAERMLIRGGRSLELEIPALVGLIEHPEQGLVLFDTGYSPRFHVETARLPGRIYAMITPVRVGAAETVAAQLAARGWRPEDVRTIVISHFHADHIGALGDFPRARLVCSRAAYAALQPRRGFQALRAGFLPGLLPSDFAARATYFEDLPLTTLDGALAAFGPGRDLFGDGSVRLVELPGHALGHHGALIAGAPAVFMIGDACWLSRNYREDRPPHPLAYLLFPDRRQYRDTLRKLHELEQARAGILIIPSHCAEARDRLLALQEVEA